MLEEEGKEGGKISIILMRMLFVDGWTNRYHAALPPDLPSSPRQFSLITGVITMQNHNHNHNYNNSRLLHTYMQEAHCLCMLARIDIDGESERASGRI